MSGYLLDSHVILWSLKEPQRLRPSHADLLSANRNLAVSVASIWEIEIKRASGKLTSPGDLLVRLADAGIRLIPVVAQHAFEAAHLPFHHRDPFDRLLIAQARIEGLTILTTDRHFARYEVALA